MRNNKETITKIGILILLFCTLLIFVLAIEFKENNSENSSYNTATTATEATTEPITTTTIVTTTVTTVTTTYVPFSTTIVGDKSLGYIAIPSDWEKDNDDKQSESFKYIRFSGLDLNELDTVYKEKTGRQSIRDRIKAVEKNDKYISISSLSVEYKDYSESKEYKNTEELLKAEANQIKYMQEYFSGDKLDDNLVVDDIKASDYYKEVKINNLKAYKFEIKLKDYYEKQGFGDGYLIVYIIPDGDSKYNALTLETNDKEKDNMLKLIRTYKRGGKDEK